MIEKFVDGAVIIDTENKTCEQFAFVEERCKGPFDYAEVCRMMARWVDESYVEDFMNNISIENIAYHIENEKRYSFNTFYVSEKKEKRRKTFLYYPLQGEKNKVFGFIQDTNEDYLREQSIAEALRQAERANLAKTTFLNNMSHDIRTPMNAIVGFTQLAEKNINNREKCEDYLNKINTASNLLLSLVNDVLDMGRIESGKVGIFEERNSIARIMSDLKNILLPDAKARKLDFDVYVENICNDCVLCDKLRLNQVLMNCASNAIKFTPAGGSVYISVSQEKEAEDGKAEYTFRIKDTGIGIDKKFIDTIYEPFSRDESMVNKIQGTGLGMAITKNLVELMNGDIQVRSTVGKGTEVIIRLRFNVVCKKDERNDMPFKDNGKREKDTIDFRGIRVLLVEDNELNTEIARTMLQDSGAIVEYAENGKEAVACFASFPEQYIDAILMDIQMPVMNGYDATKTIRSMPRKDAATVPIIAMTADAFEEDRQKALSAGMNAHVVKPFNIAAISDIIYRCINEK